MPVDRVVAKVGPAADEPLGERRAGVIAHLGERFLPVDKLCLFGPELVRTVDRILVEFLVRRHITSSYLVFLHVKSIAGLFFLACPVM